MTKLHFRTYDLLNFCLWIKFSYLSFHSFILRRMLLCWPAVFLVRAAMFSSAYVHVWTCLFFSMCLDLFTLFNFFRFIPKVDTFSESLLFSCWRLAFFATCITVPMDIWMGKVYLSKFKSPMARGKARLLSAMNFKSVDINLLCAPLFNLICFKSIGIIKKRVSHGVGHTF